MAKRKVSKVAQSNVSKTVKTAKTAKPVKVDVSKTEQPQSVRATIEQPLELVQTDQQHVSFSAPIIYVQPKFEELKLRFPAGIVLYGPYGAKDFNSTRFEPIKCCMNISTVARDVTFEYFSMGHMARVTDILEQMDKEGLRPGLYEELLGYTEEYPDEQRASPVAALGSEMVIGQARVFATLCANGHSSRFRQLQLVKAAGLLGSCFRFLAVRK